MAERGGDHDEGPAPPPYLDALPPRRRRIRRTGSRDSRAMLIIPIAIAVASWPFVGWTVREIRRVQTTERRMSVNHRTAYRALALDAVGASPEEARLGWRKLVTLLERTGVLYHSIDDESYDESYEPRYEYDMGEIDFEYVLCGEELPEDIERERQAIEHFDAEGIFDELVTIAREPMGIRPARTSEIPLMYEDVLTHLPAYTLAGSRVASMRFALESGDEGELARGFEEVMALGRTVSFQQSISNHIMGRKIQRLAVDELLHELMERRLTEETLEQLTHSVDRFALADLRLAITGERACFHEVVQRVFGDDGNGDGFMLPEAAAELDFALTGPVQAMSSSTVLDAFRSRFLLATRRETLECYDQMIEIVDRQVRQLPANRDSAAKSLWQSGLDSRQPIVPAAAVYLDSTVQRWTALIVRRAGLQAALSIERHRARHGAYPDTLDALDPTLAVPVDPLHGDPFGYRILVDDPSRRPYLLYSTGLDRGDDDGNTDEGWPERALERNWPGIDYVLNPPRPSLDEY